MIVVRTPLRVSLAGGGTDMPAFYRSRAGAVVSFTIDKYLYVSLNHKFDGKTRVSYSVTEIVDSPRDLKHDLAREALTFCETKGVEITSVSDIPGEGTGLGSSSAFIVGLLHTLQTLDNSGILSSPSALAELAFHVERKICLHPVGKQDHYAAAHGGLKYYQFNEDDTVEVQTIGDQKVIKGLEQNLMLFYTGVTRKAGSILKEQERNLEKESKVGLQMRALAIELRDHFRKGHYLGVGAILEQGWEWKKQMAEGISNAYLNGLYDTAIDAGARGGKILGAGGGGFLLLAVDPDQQHDVDQALKLQRIPFRIEHEGSQVIYDSAKHVICG